MMLYWEGVIGGGGHHLVDISPSYRFLSVRVGGMTPSSVIGWDLRADAHHDALRIIGKS